ncbi:MULTISPECIES: hypothetical protein [unclassified Burkholderia]|uniref:hypothetical protein n=1 Tax=unclassified Burkholderia TaxID=2613784 RepID=UPI0012E3AC9E|nr:MULTISPECIES: hypothetical protein [unclassified Burkholderia]
MDIGKSDRISCHARYAPQTRPNFAVRSSSSVTDKKGTVVATNSENRKPMLAQLLPLLSAIFAVAGIGNGFYLLWRNQTTNASLAFTVGILLFLLSQFERFESVKGFGIEAKVRQLDSKIREADQINAALKSLTASLAQLAFEMMSRIGRLRGPIGRKESLELEESLLQQMRDAGIADVDIARAVLPVRQIVALDVLRPAIDEVDKHLTRWELAARKRLEAVRQPIAMTDPEYIGALAANIDTETTLSIGVLVDGKIDQEIITAREKSIFSDDEDELIDELLFPELVHGATVSLTGEVTRENKTSQSMGFKYQGHILTAHPETRNIVPYKPMLFETCRLIGVVDRMDEKGRIGAKRPKLIFSSLEPISGQNRDLFD